MSVISVDSHQYLNTLLPWVFLRSFLSNHRDGLVLMSRCPPVFTLLAGAENSVWFLSTPVADSCLLGEHLTCSVLPEQTDQLWQDGLAAGCCKELTVVYEGLALLNHLFLRQTGGCTDETAPLHFACWTSCIFWGALPQLCLCSTAPSSRRRHRLVGRKLLVRAVILYCLKDAGVSCFGFTVMLYLPL